MKKIGIFSLAVILMLALSGCAKENGHNVTVAGSIRDTSSTPIASASVTASIANIIKAEATSNTNGQYSIFVEQVESGAVMLIEVSNGSISSSSTIVVNEQTNYLQDFELFTGNPFSVIISGSVKNASNDFISHASISVFKGDMEIGTCSTDLEGKYELVVESLKVGEEITIRASDSTSSASDKVIIDTSRFYIRNFSLTSLSPSFNFVVEGHVGICELVDEAKVEIFEISYLGDTKSILFTGYTDTDGFFSSGEISISSSSSIKVITSKPSFTQGVNLITPRSYLVHLAIDSRRLINASFSGSVLLSPIADPGSSDLIVTAHTEYIDADGVYRYNTATVKSQNGDYVFTDFLAPCHSAVSLYACKDGYANVEYTQYFGWGYFPVVYSQGSMFIWDGGYSLYGTQMALKKVNKYEIRGTISYNGFPLCGVRVNIDASYILPATPWHEDTFITTNADGSFTSFLYTCADPGTGITISFDKEADGIFEKSIVTALETDGLIDLGIISLGP